MTIKNDTQLMKKCETLGDVLRVKTNDAKYFEDLQFLYIKEIANEYFKKHTLPFINKQVPVLSDKYLKATDSEKQNLPKYEPFKYNIDMILLHDIAQYYITNSSKGCMNLLNNFNVLYPRFYAALCNLIESEKIFVLNFFIQANSTSTIYQYTTELLLGLENKVDKNYFNNK